MICSSCEKRQASMYVSVITDNHVVQQALCVECAGRDQEAPSLLEGLLETLGALRVRAHPARCPSCHTTFAQFKAKGRFGCADCYEQFAPQVASLLPRVHGGAYQHRGKTPRGAR